MLLSRLEKSRPFFLIAGLNVLESYSHTLAVARECVRVSNELGIALVFKASFDKANRTSLDGFRGPGLREGLKQLKQLKSDLPGLFVVTDVHEYEQCARVKDAGIDMLQIPAFLCRQTDLLLAAAETNLPVMIKKAQFASPQVMHSAVHKILSVSDGSNKVLVCERGTSVGSDLLVVDFRNLVWLRGANHLVVFDATHSGQRPPGINGNVNGVGSSGDAFAVECLARAAVAVGVDGLFLEVHQDPASAPVDSKLQYPLHRLEPFLRELVDIGNASKWRLGG
ncbi:3-deoxy-8-phosphooctulonate synthase [Batrachochytrium salamandrivorans]|nr:3-deoxy-8-phosphooctulonate synthase [Batrachochytrium salamandrivorans]